MQRFCPNCGTALDEEMMFCPSCGSPVPQPQPHPQFAPQRANVYPQYSPAFPQTPPVASQTLGGAPGVSKVMVILYLVTFVFVSILSAVSVANYGGSFNNGVNLILNVVLGFTAAILMLLGAFIRKAPALYGAGLLVLAVSSLISIARTLLSGYGAATATVVFNSLSILFYVIPLIIASIHYFANGRGIKGGLKNAMTVLAFVYILLANGYDLVELIDLAVRYGSSGALFIWSIFTVVISVIGSLFLFIATLAFTVRRKTA